MIIGISGFAGSGKSTIAEYLIDKGFDCFSFADSLKDALATIFGWNRILLEGNTTESRIWRETTDNWWSNKLNIQNFTPRKAMQLIGTDLFRNHFNSDIWIYSLERKLAQHKNVVIPDCRFPNEIQMVRNLNGVMIRVTGKNNKSFTLHQSELAWLNEEFDLEINNTGTLKELYNLIDQDLIPLVSR